MHIDVLHRVLRRHGVEPTEAITNAALELNQIQAALNSELNCEDADVQSIATTVLKGAVDSEQRVIIAAMLAKLNMLVLANEEVINNIVTKMVDAGIEQDDNPEIMLDRLLVLLTKTK